jgi:DNA-binding Lrp family transcriptional regulator
VDAEDPPGPGGRAAAAQRAAGAQGLELGQAGAVSVRAAQPHGVPGRAWKSVRGQLLTMPEVDHVALTSGAHDILLRVRARDAASLRDVVLTRLQDMPEVRSTQTVLIFEEVTPVRRRP